jgi:hypothetical protein
MKKLILILIVLFFIFFTLLNAEKLMVLKEVLKPESIEIYGDKLYVVQGSNFYVYDLEKLKLESTFGRKGEGPGELKEVPMLPNSIKILPDKIFVDGMGKVIFYSKNFKFQKEIKKKYMTFKTIPVGENFVAMRMLPAGKNKYYFSVLLLDSEMNMIKELYKQEYRETDIDIDMVIDSIHFAVYQDKIYIEKSKQGFCIAIFDSQGNLELEIKKDFKAPEISPKDKLEILENFKQDSLVKMMMEREGGWTNFKNKMNFNYPKNFPVIQDVLVVDNQIIVATYDRKNLKRKYILMDLKGTVLKTVYLPIPRESSYLTMAMGRDNRFYGIVNQKYYYLKENPDSEEWEIHVSEFD